MSFKRNDTIVNRDPLREDLRKKSRDRKTSLKNAASHQVSELQPRNDLLPKLELVDLPIDQLKMPIRRTRKLGVDNMIETANTISHLGFSVPILIGRDNRVIDGEARVTAARHLGLTSLPCVRVDHLDEGEERVLRLAMNRLGHQREYNLPELQNEFRELLSAHQPIRVMGFTGPELDQILRLDPVIEKERSKPSSGDGTAAVNRPGDLWKLGDHLLFCGDAKDPKSHHILMGADRARLVLTDPPYAVDVSKVVSTKHRDFVEGGGDMTLEQFCAMVSDFLGNCYDMLDDGGIVLSFMDWKHIAELIDGGKDAGFELINVITWVKPQAGMGSLWRSQHEFVAALKKPGQHKNNIMLGKNGRDRSNCWFVAGAGTVGTDARKTLGDHPTPKPVDMLVDAILDVTDREDIVLDPFGGSGSTLIACEHSGRVARLMELDPLYCNLIIERWQEETGLEAILTATGDRFATVAEQRMAEEPGDLETIDAPR